MALFEVLPPRNPLTDLHKIWHGRLCGRRHSICQMACQSVQGSVRSFFSAARSQTALSILTSYISKRLFQGPLHSFRGLEQRYHNLRGLKSPKTAKIGPN